MSLISSLAKSFNFKIPESLSSITGKGIVDTVKNLAKVAGDTFLKPSTDGKSIFQSEINVLGMRLPNPVNVLAEKLLGAAGDKIRDLGFSPEAIANLFSGGRALKSVNGETTLPTLNDRVKELTTKSAATKTDGKGGGTVKTQSATTPKQAGGSSTPVATTGADYADQVIGKFGGSLSSLDSQINGLINKGGELSQTEMLKLQQQMQKRSELYQMMSQIISMEHETKKNVIGNIR
ncbi:MAG TPA: hypothetical protein VGK67_39250 [Myxococcales bacterium]|jgi:hypothetical protein